MAQGAEKGGDRMAQYRKKPVVIEAVQFGWEGRRSDGKAI